MKKDEPVLTDEHLKMMAWAYRKGFTDAATTLASVSESVNEDSLFKQFQQGMMKYSSPHQTEGDDNGNQDTRE